MSTPAAPSASTTVSSSAPAAGPAASAQSKIQIVEADADEEEDDLEERKESDFIRTEEKQPASSVAPSAAAASSSQSANATADSNSKSTPVDDLSSPFHLIPSSFSKDTHPAVSSYYHKWNLDSTCCALKLRYLEQVNFLDPTAAHAFFTAMWNSPAFRKEWKHLQAKEKKMAPMDPRLVVTKVNYKPVKTTAVDLHFFDRLWKEEGQLLYGTLDDPIPDLRSTAEDISSPSSDRESSSSSAASSGALKKCFEEILDGGVPVTDELRKMILDRDSDNYDMYSNAERSELLFLLFQHLLVGGGLNQYENTIHPYLGVLKLVYKDLLSVKTNRNTNQVEIANLVYRVDNLVVRSPASASAAAAGSEAAYSIFGKREKDRFHVCLVSVDTQRKHVTVYYFAHTDAW